MRCTGRSQGCSVFGPKHAGCFAHCLHRAAPRWSAGPPVLVAACQFGTAWAGLRLNPFIHSAFGAPRFFTTKARPGVQTTRPAQCDSKRKPIETGGGAAPLKGSTVLLLSGCAVERRV